MSEVMVSGSLMNTMKSAEIDTRYEASWDEFVAAMREDHERIIGPTLEDKEENSLFSVGVFEGGQWTSKDGKRTAFYPEGIRDRKHLLHCGVLGFDYDGKDVDNEHFLTPAEFSRRMSGVLHFTYSTHGSTLERPKFRSFVAVDRCLVGERGQEYKDLSRFVVDVKFPAHAFDPASFDATRGFLRPCHNAANMDAAFFHTHEGNPIGVDSWLNECYRRRDLKNAARIAELAEQEAARASFPPSRRKRKARPNTRGSAVNYCRAVPVVERNTMLNVGRKLLNVWGPEIAQDVWREHIASRYISDSRGGSVLTSDEMDKAWRWIVEHASNNKNNIKQEQDNCHENTNEPRPDNNDPL